MRRDYIKWYSPSLGRDMELLAYGHAGFPIVVFPTSGGRFFEYEDRGMVGALAPKIDRGELQVMCVDSVDQESWYNRSIAPPDRLHRQNAFDAYLTFEVAPFVRDRSEEHTSELQSLRHLVCCPRQDRPAFPPRRSSDLVQPVDRAARSPAPAERFRCVLDLRSGAVRARPHHLGTDRRHRVQFRRIPFHQLRAAASRYREIG